MLLLLLMILIFIISIILIFEFNKSNKTPWKENKPINFSQQCGSLPPVIPSTQNIMGLWSGGINSCGNGIFDIVSLASVLPQDYDPSNIDKFFYSQIQGYYDKNYLTSTKTKFIISLGGSNATSDGWDNFFDKLQNKKDIDYFYNECIKRGIVGIDFDIENSTKDYTIKFSTLVKRLKTYYPNFIVMCTILLGRPDTFDLIVNENNYDYLSLMLYNGGMYFANVTGGGCDWDGWAELFLSRGTNGCSTPNGQSVSEYCKLNGADLDLSKINPSKVLLGINIDSEKAPFTESMNSRMKELINKYGGGGYMIWTIPGFELKDNLETLIKRVQFITDLKNIDIETNVKDTCRALNWGCRLSGNMKECTKSCCKPTDCGKFFIKDLTDSSCINGCFPSNGGIGYPCKDDGGNNLNFCACFD